MTSAGWATVNVWYDHRREAEPGSALEVLYSLVFDARQESRYFESVFLARAILDAPLQVTEGMKPSGDLPKLEEKYASALFPGMRRAREENKQKEKERYNKWIQQTDYVIGTPLLSSRELRREWKKAKRHPLSMTTPTTTPPSPPPNVPPPTTPSNASSPPRPRRFPK